LLKDRSKLPAHRYKFVADPSVTNENVAWEEANQSTIPHGPRLTKIEALLENTASTRIINSHPPLAQHL
jgi:hypothetical protein